MQVSAIFLYPKAAKININVTEIGCEVNLLNSISLRLIFILTSYTGLSISSGVSSHEILRIKLCINSPCHACYLSRLFHPL
jgi:hypothetical protein